MTRRYNPQLHDPILTELNHKWRRTDQEIADAMGFDRDTITKHRTRIGLPRYNKPMPVHHREPERAVAPPKGKQNPLAVAQMWLGRRLVEKPSGYWLDGVPVNLADIMRTTNRLLKDGGAEQIMHNPLWEV